VNVWRFFMKDKSWTSIKNCYFESGFCSTLKEYEISEKEVQKVEKQSCERKSNERFSSLLFISLWIVFCISLFCASIHLGLNFWSRVFDQNYRELKNSQLVDEWNGLNILSASIFKSLDLKIRSFGKK